MSKKSKNKQKFKYKVEDHGNGYVVVRNKANSLKWPKFQGVTPDEARAVLSEYEDGVERFAFACPIYYEGKSACWLSTHPGANWEGSRDVLGNPLPR